MRLPKMVRAGDEGWRFPARIPGDVTTVPSLLYQTTVHQCPWYLVVERSLKKTTSSGVCVCAVGGWRVEGVACLMAVLHV